MIHWPHASIVESLLAKLSDSNETSADVEELVKSVAAVTFEGTHCRVPYGPILILQYQLAPTRQACQFLLILENALTHPQTFAMLQAMFVAMSLYPDVQKKAQTELDAVVGRDRLPKIEDREALVYINALVKELLRWHNVTPLGIAHRTIEDDEFQGFFIPGGTVLVANVWFVRIDSVYLWRAVAYEE